MKAIFNSRVIDTRHPVLTLTNRAFCYGDGLFETIVTGPSRINLIDRHLVRLQEGAIALGMEYPQALNFEQFALWSQQLIGLNNIQNEYRIRIHLWRNPGGLYTPETDKSSFIIEIDDHSTPLLEGQHRIGLNEEYKNVLSPISQFKSKNALKYIMLGRDKAKRGLDDIILTDQNKYLSESFSSNLFWVKNNEIYTPALSTGCVSGIMRSFIIDYFKSTNQPIHEVKGLIQEIESCDAIFTSNGAGIKWFRYYENITLSSPETILAPLIKRLRQP